MENKKKIYTIIFLLVLSGICLTGAVASFLIKKPLAPPLSIETSEIRTPTAGLDFPVPLPTSLIINVPTATSRPVTESTKPAEQPLSEIFSPSATPLPIETSMVASRSIAEVFDLCALDKPQSVLLIGINNEDENRIHPINFIRLVNFNSVEQKISVFAISQNTIITGQMLERLNIPESQLGDVYNYVINNASGNPKDIQFVASNYLAQSLFDAFGFIPSHFITFDVSSSLSSILQSERIYLPESPKPLDVNEIITHLLSGTNVEEDFANPQNIILLALLEHLQENDYETIVSSLSALSGESVITDLNTSQFSQLFCILNNIDQGMINFQTLSK